MLQADQDQRSVGPDLGPNCLQRLSTDNFLHKQGTSLNQDNVREYY